jgi:hypothetical protein
MARAAVPCKGDFEPDGDVDGSDLAAWIAAGPSVVGIDTTAFARNFGRNACP